jgi:hypothetical protein
VCNEFYFLRHAPLLLHLPSFQASQSCFLTGVQHVLPSLSRVFWGRARHMVVHSTSEFISMRERAGSSAAGDKQQPVTQWVLLKSKPTPRDIRRRRRVSPCQTERACMCVCARVCARELECVRQRPTQQACRSSCSA